MRIFIAIYYDNTRLFDIAKFKIQRAALKVGIQKTETGFQKLETEIRKAESGIQRNPQD